MFVYLINQSDSSLYKIGLSENPNKRRKQLQTANGVQLDLIKQFKTEFGFKLEKSLHRHFKPKQTIGEFFDLEDKDVSEFETICERIEKNLKYLKENNSYIGDRKKW